MSPYRAPPLSSYVECPLRNFSKFEKQESRKRKKRKQDFECVEIRLVFRTLLELAGAF